MDPLLIAAVAVVAAMFVGPRLLAGPDRRTRTLELAPNVTVCLTAEQQEAACLRRNLVFEQLEIAAYNRGEIGHELYGSRMAAIHRVPQSVKKPGQAGFAGFD